MIKNNVNKILKEINLVLDKINQAEVDKLVEAIQRADKIVCVGAGRVGMANRAFAMRLGHLGKTAYSLGDSTLPTLTPDSLLLVASGSGETQTIFDLTEAAQKKGCKIILITGNLESRIAKLADKVLKIEAPSKVKEVAGFKSMQPMTTLNEQCLTIFFDALVLQLMSQLNETHDTMWARHSSLE